MLFNNNSCFYFIYIESTVLYIKKFMYVYMKLSLKFYSIFY